MVKILGSAFDLSYRRTTPYPIDATSVFDTIEDARVYARNNDTETYVPYAGQVISVLENGAIYKLVKDTSIPETDSRKHYKLDPIGGNNDNDDRYVRKDIAETIEKLMTFLEGINAKGISTLEGIKLLNDIVSSNFSTGSTGFGIYKDSDGNYHLDIDFVDIRKKLSVEEIQVQQSRYVGGKQWNNDGIICTHVEDAGTYWKCYFKMTDSDGRTVHNPFEPGDQAISETFNLKSGNRYYWRLVNIVGNDYVGLLKSDCASGSDEPLGGDEIVQLGNRTNTVRQGTVCLDSVTPGGPYVRVYNGIDSYHLPEPKIDLNPYQSIIKAKLISEATGKDIDTILKDTQTDLDLIKQQTDKEYTLWFFEYDPTLSNIPASEWTTSALKTMHEQDMFYNRATGLAYRFEKSGDTWAWNPIADQQTVKALENAAKAQDTADGKRRIFVNQPTNADAYDIGDMWVNAVYSDKTVTYNNDSLVCKTAKAAGQSFSISHWQPSSTATTAYLENLGDRILAAVTDAEDGIAAAKDLANQGISDAYDAAQEALLALGIARDTQEEAGENTAAIQVMKDSISALVQGVHFDNNGNITNINTSGLVTTDDFNALLSKKVNFDGQGHITNISTSGLVTELGFAQIFSERAEADGYVKRVDISTFITEDEAGRLISNAEISADQIRFNGNIVANDTFFVDEKGNLTLNNVTAVNGLFKGKLITQNSGKRIEIDPETSSIKMYDADNYVVAEIGFDGSVEGSTLISRIRLASRSTLDSQPLNYMDLQPDRLMMSWGPTRPSPGYTPTVMTIDETGIVFTYGDTVLAKYPSIKNVEG